MKKNCLLSTKKRFELKFNRNMSTIFQYFLFCLLLVKFTQFLVEELWDVYEKLNQCSPLTCANLVFHNTTHIFKMINFNK